MVYQTSLRLKQTPLTFPRTHLAVESLSLVYFWLRVRGSIDHFPSSAQWCCFKPGVYQRLIWKNGCIWGLPSIIGAERVVFSRPPVTFDESPLKTPLGKAGPGFALARRHCIFLLSLRFFWQDILLLIVPQPFVHVAHYFSLCLFVVGPQKVFWIVVGEINFLCYYFEVSCMDILWTSGCFSGVRVCLRARLFPRIE